MGDPLPRLSLSGAELDDTEAVEGLTEVLGGQLLKGVILQPECTHLLVGKLAKREKVLAALARGIPILDLGTYLPRCLEEERWITDEEELKEFDLGSVPADRKQVATLFLTILFSALLNKTYHTQNFFLIKFCFEYPFSFMI